MNNSTKLFNRELSWISFNHRVLQEAADKSVPLFERIKFLAIFSSNLEEFFRVRVSSIRNLLSLKEKTLTELDFEPRKLLSDIHSKVNKLQKELGGIFKNEIIPVLKEQNIFLKNEKELDSREKEFLTDYFIDTIRQHLTPMIIVKKKIKPFLKSGNLFFAIKLSSKSLIKKSKAKRKFIYALVEIPTDKLQRFIRLPSRENEMNIIFLDDAIRYCLKYIFEGYKTEEVCSVKLTRDAEIYIDDEFSGNLLEKIKKGINKRASGVPSRFLFDENISKDFLKFLRESLSLSKEDLVPGARYHNFSDFFNFPFAENKELLYEDQAPLEKSKLNSTTGIFSEISEKDYLLHYPYESFDPVVKFFKAASDDENVKSIKVTLYRAAKNSLLIQSLIDALNKGKQVTVFIEIKARFDEELNIDYAKKLELAGAKILYSLPGLKVHAKLAQVIRNENGIDKSYCYLSTGNFNEKTAKLYSDYGLFTTDERITCEIAGLFDYLEGHNHAPEFKHLLVSQFNMKKEFIRLIDNEIKNSLNGKPSYIKIKLNSLEDKKMIEKLYEASNAGVKVLISVRGVCCLKPGVKNLSENIKAVSIVDRFLEHSRVFIFHNGGNEKIYLSSADWMKRNLSRRIEVAFPLYDGKIRKKIQDLLNLQFADNVKARIIDEAQKNFYAKDDSESHVRAQIKTFEYLKETEETE